MHKRRSGGSGRETSRRSIANRFGTAAERAFLVALLFASASPAHAAADLPLVPDPVTLPLRLFLFVCLVFVCNALIFKPVFAALDERTRRVDGARKRAEEVEQESDALLKRYEAALREARAEADSDRKNTLGHAREEQLGMAEAARALAEAKVEEARAGLEAALVTAREGLKAASRDIAQAVAARVIGREL